jgi:hypothetical protein
MSMALTGARRELGTVNVREAIRVRQLLREAGKPSQGDS